MNTTATPATRQLPKLPTDRHDRPLVQVGAPRHDLDELILPEQVRTVLDEVTRENLRRSALTAHALRPRQRLLFTGPPGTGKSAAAHGIAAALSLPVATASLAALTSSYLGDTARNIESIVRYAERTSCVLVFDEFDVIGQERSQPGDHGEMRRVAATVLQLLDDTASESLIIATTNHPGSVDTATWRRFDDIIGFGHLDSDQAAELITMKLRALPAVISPHQWAQRVVSASPADIERVCIDAMRIAVLANQHQVDDVTMAAAVDRLTTRRRAISGTSNDVEITARAKGVTR